MNFKVWDTVIVVITYQGYQPVKTLFLIVSVSISIGEYRLKSERVI